MTILVFDTETTGFADRKKPLLDPGQPHLVQLACALIQNDGTEIMAAHLIIRPEGFTIPPTATKVHGITHDLALAVGIPVKLALLTFTHMRARATTAIAAHNEEFDRFIMDIELARLNAEPAHAGPQRHICTAQESAKLVGIPPTAAMIKWGHGDKCKTPKLDELHRFLFNEPFIGAHNALHDMRALIRCLIELRKRGVCL